MQFHLLFLLPLSLLLPGCFMEKPQPPKDTTGRQVSDEPAPGQARPLPSQQPVSQPSGPVPGRVSPIPPGSTATPTPSPAPSPVPAPAPAPSPAPSPALPDRSSPGSGCTGEVVTFVAHAGGDQQQPYKVGVAGDAYVNFTFPSPWKGKVYAYEFTPVIDNDIVLHHWLLYKTAAGSSSRELVHGWAPGGEAGTFGDGVAMGLQEGTYTLNMHYNSTDAAATDASGVSICITKEKPRHEAELIWLGTDRIFNVREATGVCNPVGPGPINIVGVSPHMHTYGRQMTSIITRADGTKEVLHDEPFTFDSQVSYPKNIVLQPGDSIATTCKWDREVRFGRGTGDEMCYLFTVAWPVGALRSGGRGLHGPNSCMGSLFGP